MSGTLTVLLDGVQYTGPLTLTPKNPPSPPPPPPPPGPVGTVFYDDFSAFTLRNNYNPASTPNTIWMPGYDGYDPVVNGTKIGQSWLVNPYNPATPIPCLASVNGALQLTVKRTPSQYASACGNSPYVAGSMNTNGTWSRKYGYWEARIRHDHRVAGCGMAWWLWNTGTDSSEIDMLESYGMTGGQDFSSQTIHTGNDTGDKEWDSWSTDLTQWHTWGADWQAGHVTTYVDRAETATINNPNGFTAPMQMMIGGGDSASSQAVDVAALPLIGMYDYVGVWPSPPF